jgi:hypothetical protein
LIMSYIFMLSPEGHNAMSAIISVGTYSGGLQGWVFDGTDDLKVKYSFGAHDGAVKAMHGRGIPCPLQLHPTTKTNIIKL